MTDLADDKGKFGCSAWIESIRGTVNEQWTKARSTLQKKTTKENMTSQPFTAKTDVEGSGDLVVARKQRLSPRPAVVNMREDINSLRAMIASLDAADNAKAELITDNSSSAKWSDGMNSTGIDVDTVVHDVLIKARSDCETEMGRMTLFDTFATKGSTSSTSSQLSDLADAIVNESLSKIIGVSLSDVGIDIKLDHNHGQEDYSDDVFYNGIIIEVVE